MGKRLNRTLFNWRWWAFWPIFPLLFLLAVVDGALRGMAWLGELCWQASRSLNRATHPLFVWVRKGATP